MPKVNKKPVGKKCLRFIVVADTHINQSDSEAASFFPLNRLANSRSRQVAAMINEVGAEFVLHLGDIVHPIPGKPTYSQAAECFREIYSDVRIPIKLVPGNHDIGDKPGASAPVATIKSSFIDAYKETFGDPWYSFDINDLHFVIINAPVINSGLNEEHEQRVWLEKDLSDNQSKRIFIGIHYPPYVTSKDEPGSYDNIDEPGRSWLLDLIEQSEVEAVFCGHVHNFWYDLYGDTEIYLAPSTAFVRQDYSEFMRIEPPGDEGGRADVDKLGFFVVDVYEAGHVAMWVRSNGELRDQGSTTPVVMPDYEIHTKISALENFGVDMRHPWAEIIELPPSGALEEFHRKSARNDYPLCAVWDMGITLLRIPVQDLLDDVVRKRMEVAAAVGTRFILSSFKVPENPQLLGFIREYEYLFDSIEITLPAVDIENSISPLLELKTKTQIPIFLSKLRRSEDSKIDGLQYGHLIFYGWVVEELHEVAPLLENLASIHAIDGVTFRVGRNVDPATVLDIAHSYLKQINLGLMLNIRLAGDSPASCEIDDEETANRVGQVARLARANPMIRFYLDTFMDVDRGYFRRSGLLDRAYNLRRAGKVLRKQGVLAAIVK